MLDIGSLGAIEIMLAFAKSPSTKSGDLAGINFIRPKGLVLCLSMIIRPPKSGPGQSLGPFDFESIIDFDIPPVTNSRRPTRKQRSIYVNLNFFFSTYEL